MTSPDNADRFASPAMSAQDACALVGLFAERGIDVWVDGGWGVDALLGRQTRPHQDLDIAVRHRDVPQIRALLQERGFLDVPRSGTLDCNFVLGHPDGRQVDVHSFEFNDAGELTFGLAYPLESLTGTGSIAGLTVKCISPEWMVRFHSGYELDVDDHHDISALCERYGIEFPDSR